MLTVVLSVAASAAAADYTFAQFKLDHEKVYESAAEEAKRATIFDATKREIEAHNKDTSQTWTKAVNQFSDMTPEEFRGSHGWVNAAGLDQHGIASFSESALEIPSDFKLADLPKTVDWRTKGVVSPVKNQGMCGSCWAFSSTENVESHVALNAKLSVAPVLSPQNLVSCDPNPKHCGGKGGCLGSVPELAFDYIQEFGLASEADWPYVSGHTSVNEACNNSASPAAHITGYTKLKANNYTEVMYTLANVGPVAVNVDAIPMQSYGGGLMTGCAMDATHIDHVVQLVGYGYDSDFDKNYWIMRNSWGTTWGIAGYMHLLRHDPTDQWCSIDIFPADGTGCGDSPPTVTTCGSCGVLFDVSYPIGGSVPNATLA